MPSLETLSLQNAVSHQTDGRLRVLTVSLCNNEHYLSNAHCAISYMVKAGRIERPYSTCLCVQ